MGTFAREFDNEKENENVVQTQTVNQETQNSMNVPTKEEYSFNNTVKPGGFVDMAQKDKSNIANLQSMSYSQAKKEKNTSSEQIEGKKFADGYVENPVEEHYNAEEKKRAELDYNDPTLLKQVWGVDEKPVLEDDSKKKKAQKWAALNDGMHLLTRMIFATEGKKPGVDIGGKYDSIANYQKEIDDIANRNTARMQEYTKFLNTAKLKLSDQKIADFERAEKRKKDADDRNTVKYSNKDTYSDEEVSKMTEAEKQQLVKLSNGKYAKGSSADSRVYAGYPLQGGGFYTFTNADRGKANNLLGALRTDADLLKKIDGAIKGLIDNEGNKLFNGRPLDQDNISVIFGELSANPNTRDKFYKYCEKYGFPVSSGNNTLNENSHTKPASQKGFDAL